MAPLRRYLRITKYSVLECRIYLDEPALAHSWLLHPRNPILPRVIESVRPLVLPKLREERERSRKKSTKKRGIKDTVTEDDFEVSIFLTETNTRHSMLYKHKHFRDTTQTKLMSNSTKLTGASRSAPVDVIDNDEDETAETFDEAASDIPTTVHILREEDDDDEDNVRALQDIPAIDQEAPAVAGTPTRTSKRRRGRGTVLLPSSDEDAEEPRIADISMLSDNDHDLFVGQDDDDEDADDDTGPRPAKRRKDEASAVQHEPGWDDKKKLAMHISYEGFSIYGRVLCLVVKRRGGATTTKGKAVAVAGGGPGGTAGPGAAPGGQATMENWITSTQMPEAVANGLLDTT